MKTRTWIIIMVVLLWSVLDSTARRSTAQGPEPFGPVIGRSLKNDLSPPLRDIQPQPLSPSASPFEVPRLSPPPPQPDSPHPSFVDPVRQNAPSAPLMPTPNQNYSGISNRWGVYPPDTNGDVGPNHYVQMVNLGFAIWNKNGVLLYGPANTNTLWAGFGGICETTNRGDPIVLYDPLADRWMMTQFAFTSTSTGPFYECIAISQTPDPTGAYYRYAFLVHNSKFNDYPKFGVWPDAYYMSVNQFTNFGWSGAGVFAFDRANMLLGNAATFVYFDLYTVNSGYASLLPADLDGPPPPPNSPNAFVSLGSNVLNLWRFKVNWLSPADSTFGVLGTPNAVLSTAPFDSNLCGFSRNCIPQFGTAQRLDAIADRLMYRLQYRNFGSHESLVVNHTVDENGADHAAIRWYELRNPSNIPFIYQQGTFAPDAEHRWMGSVAMDANGNIALGYSASSDRIYPSIRYTGRLAGDPLGALPQGETTLIAGSGAQLGSGARWGDYSMLAVDPTDDCTFWYTTEYYTATSVVDWATRIGSFKFPSCTTGPRGALTGVVSQAANGAPIVGAQVQASASPTQSNSVTTIAGGQYVMGLPATTYTVTASAYGYAPATVSGVAVVSGTTTTQNLALNPVPAYVVSGTVRDATTGWPLYARLNVVGYPGGAIWNDPVSGFYSLSLASGLTYTFNISSWVNGYDVMTRSVVVNGPRTENFNLNANLSTCLAPGYQHNLVYFQDFESSNGGFVVTYTNFFTTSWQWGIPTNGPGSAHSGSKLWATHLSSSYLDNEDGYLTSPNINLSAYSGQTPILTWWQWLQTESFADYASIEVSRDGGGSWSRVYGEVSGNISMSWARFQVTLDPSYAVGNFRMRFRFRSNAFSVYPGWYVDDVGIALLPTPAPLYTQNFDASNGGFAITNTNFFTTSWQWGAPTSGPGNAHSGANVWATNLSGNYLSSEDGYLMSPNIDLSAANGLTLTLSWWQWLQTESFSDYANLEVSNNGGNSWTSVYGYFSGDVNLSWAQQSVSLSPAYAVNNFRVRFHFLSNAFTTFPGWYVDDLAIHALPNTIPCVPVPGGLVVGNVYDDNTNAALTGAAIINDNGRNTLAAPTVDAAVQDAFYVLFSPAGAHLFTATASGGYAADVRTVIVPAGNTVQQDFRVPAGRLVFAPQQLSVTLPLSSSSSILWDITNSGKLSATAVLQEIPRGFEPTVIGIFQRPQYVISPARQEQVDARGLSLPPMIDVPPYAAGNVLRSWPSGLTGPWGIVYDQSAGTVWVSNPAPNWGGDNRLYEFTTAGVRTGRSHAYTWNPTNGPADIAYNRNTGTFWVMDVATSGSNCIYEISPVGGYTNKRICPGGVNGFAISQRGLAYDSDTDSWYAGGWNDFMIHHFNSAGVLLDEIRVGLPIAGLTYNPDTRHVFVMVNDSLNRVYVLNAANNYAQLGQFSVSAGFGAFSGAGLEMDCDGHLWAVDQATKTVYQFESGEATTLCSSDVPWLSESPVTNTLSALGNQAVSVTFDASAVTQPGQYTAQLKLKHNTPYAIANVPVTMTVTAPASWGQVHGAVYSQGYCDNQSYVLANARTLITYSNQLTQTFVQGNSGGWVWWAPAGLMTITTTAPNHLTQTTTIQVQAGQGLNQDVHLRWLHNCGGVSPSPVTLVVPNDTVITAPISLTNRGAVSWAWSLSESSSWLSIVGATAGSLNADGQLSKSLTINTQGMLAGATHDALILIAHNDSLQTNPLPLLVRMNVVARAAGVALNVAPSAQNGSPGSVVTYSVRITNVGNLADNFVLSLSGNAWTTQAAGDTGVMAVGGGVTIPLVVHIPANADSGATDLVTLHVTSQNDSTKSAQQPLQTTAIIPITNIYLPLIAR